MKAVWFLLLFSFNSILAQGYICAIGGGSEDYNDWSDQPYGWIVEKADSGKIIILGTDDATNWLPDYFKHLGAKEAYNLKIPNSTTANLQSIYDELISANAIFIRGGDQYQYIRYWKDTKTEDAIRHVFNKGGVIAGTSAGAMILGSFVFTAKYGSVTSREALKNPLTSKIDIDTGFVNLIPLVLFDTHFIERGRLGRMFGFIIKLKEAGYDNITGVGIDDQTALCIDKNGIAEVMGSAAVAFFYSEQGSLIHFMNEICGEITSDQLTNGFKYDIPNRQIVFVPPSAKFVEQKKLERVKPFVLFSGSDKTENNIGFGLSKFQLMNQPEGKFLIIYDSKAKLVADSILYHYPMADTLVLFPGISNSIYATDKIKSFNSFLFLAFDLANYNSLTDTTSNTGNALLEKLRKETTKFYFLGNASKLIGEYYIDNTDKDQLASYHGQLVIRKGLGVINDFILQPMTWEEDKLLENRISALLYGMMRNRKPIGIYSTDEHYLMTETFEMTLDRGFLIPFIIVNTCSSSIADSSVYKAGSNYNQRQVVALNNIKYGICNRAQSNYSFYCGKWDLSDDVESEGKTNATLKLSNNFPNPFGRNISSDNQSTTFYYQLPSAGWVNIKIFDILGREVTTLVNQIKEAGNHKVSWNSRNNYNKDVPSGIYFCNIRFKDISITNKMVLVR